MTGLLAQVPLVPQYGPELATQLAALCRVNNAAVALWIANCAEALIPLVKDHPDQSAAQIKTRVGIIEDAVDNVRRSALKTDGGHDLIRAEQVADGLKQQLAKGNPFNPPHAWYAAFICTKINPENDIDRALDVAWAMRRAGYSNDQLLNMLEAAKASKKGRNDSF